MGAKHVSKLPDICFMCLVQVFSLPKSSESRRESTVNMVRKGHPTFPQLAKSEVTSMEIICVHKIKPLNDQEKIVALTF